MSLKKFLLSRTFLINVVIAFLIVILILTATLIGLKKYTHHGEAYPVPDLRGLTEQEVREKVAAEDLNYRIIDSAYIKNDKPGCVIDQVPKPGFKVKENRTILITINSKAPEQVTLPKLRDISYREAQVLIEDCGLVLGDISFMPSEYDNLVLKALHDSTEVFKGDVLPAGSVIDLVLGKGSGFKKTAVPNLIGLTISEAKTVILDSLLNPGVIIYDESIITTEDSLDAKLWKQRPEPGKNRLVELGSSIDMWVTVDQGKLPDAFGN